MYSEGPRSDIHRHLRHLGAIKRVPAGACVASSVASTVEAVVVHRNLRLLHQLPHFLPRVRITIVVCRTLWFSDPGTMAYNEDVTLENFPSLLSGVERVLRNTRENGTQGNLPRMFRDTQERSVPVEGTSITAASYARPTISDVNRWINTFRVPPVIAFTAWYVSERDCPEDTNRIGDVLYYFLLRINHEDDLKLTGYQFMQRLKTYSRILKARSGAGTLANIDLMMSNGVIAASGDLADVLTQQYSPNPIAPETPPWDHETEDHRHVDSRQSNKNEY